MIRTRIVEARAGKIAGHIEEVELGWCLLAEVPVEKKQPAPPMPGMPPPTPLVCKVNGRNCFIIGHSWDIETKAIGTLGGDLEEITKAYGLPDAILILIVQEIPVAPSGLVKAPAAALDQLDQMGGARRLANGWKLD